MLALITGASSGIGRDMSYYLSSLGYDLILVARREDRLQEIRNKIDTNVEIIPLDLSKIDNCYKLYDLVKDKNIDFLINNAGFGLFGDTMETDLDKELEMIDVNIKAVHILTKLFLNDFYRKDRGRILNVASTIFFSVLSSSVTIIFNIFISTGLTSSHFANNVKFAVIAVLKSNELFNV